MILELNIAEELGTHLADVTKALVFCDERIAPGVTMNAEIVVDFTGVRHGNSSFVNGLLTGLIEEHGEALLEKMTFRGCNPLLRVLVEGAIALGIEKHDHQAKA
jgi:hypothetical protein